MRENGRRRDEGDDVSRWVDDPLTEVLRSGAQRLLVQAIEVEAEAFLALTADWKLEDDRARSGCDQATVVHRPRLLSDNGSSYVAGDLPTWLEERDITHVRGAPYHPQTQGKIERWHQTLKNRILLKSLIPLSPPAQDVEFDIIFEGYRDERFSGFVA